MSLEEYLRKVEEDKAERVAHDLKMVIASFVAIACLMAFSIATA